VDFFMVASFTDDVFKGNPAGVCLLHGDWLPDEIMQKIAAQINLSETAFVLEHDGELGIRWFTPTTEVNLCGHATLAAAHVLRERFGGGMVFKSENHVLPVNFENDMLVLDFPMDKIWQIGGNDSLCVFNAAPKEYWRGTDEYLLVFENEEQVKSAVCDFKKAANIDLSGFIITAKADKPGFDFVSRYFGPKIGINEDPVTGSAHTLLVPYWKQVTGMDEFRAAQLSKRGGELFCRAVGERVKIAGKAVAFLVGEIII